MTILLGEPNLVPPQQARTKKIGVVRGEQQLSAFRIRRGRVEQHDDFTNKQGMEF